MNQKSLIPLALAAFFFLPIISSNAQETQISLQFITFPTTVEPMKIELLLTEGRTIELLVPSNELSPIVRIPALTSLILGETMMNEEDKPEFEIYGQGKPTSAPKQLVLLIRKGKDMASGFEVRAISSNMNQFDGGKILFVNATKIDIAGNAGQMQFALKPSDHKIIKPKPGANGRLAEVKFWYNKNGEAVPFFNSMWPVADQFRGLVFFYHAPDNQYKIQIHSFRDFMQEE